MIYKKVKFYDQSNANEVVTVSVGDNLKVRFRPVLTRNCKPTDSYKLEDLLEDFHIVKRQPYIPKWLKIDFRFGRWFGEFGYA